MRKLGLDIHGCCTDKSYGKGYTVLHMIRHLALRTAGYKGEFLDFIKLQEGPNGNYPYDKYPQFWQLLHFSDCEGILVRGDYLTNVDYEKSFHLGSSGRLLNELRRVREEITKDVSKWDDGTRSLQAFWDLYNLVEDECENGCGTIKFS